MRAFLFFTFFLIICTAAISQTLQDSIYSKFNNYLKLPESSIYLHLNKSVLVPGEDLGFAAYIYDYKNEKPAMEVRNLYCQLLDSDHNVVKEKLLLVREGKTAGKFAIDSLVPAGDYSIKAFTNWMRNFKDPHFYQAPIKILDVTKKESSSSNSQKFSATVNTESGNLIDDVANIVVVKTILPDGNKLSGFKVQLLENGAVLMNKTTDELGLARFTLIPKKDKQYFVLILKSDQIFKKQLNSVSSEGFTLSIKNLRDFFYVTANTNENTLKKLKNQELTITVNSKDTIQLYTNRLKAKETIWSLKKDSLRDGIHQVTLFNESGELLAKRLFHNENDVKEKLVPEIYVTKVGDSLKTNILLENGVSGTMSISVLPSSSIAIDPYQRIKSHFQWNPYLSSSIKQDDSVGYSERKRQYVLDNLLISSGRYLYDWDLILKDRISFKYEYESGILVKANVQSKNQRHFVIYGGENNDLSTIQLQEDESNFMLSEFFPTGEEQFLISSLSDQGQNKKVSIYTQFFPRTIPFFNKHKQLYSLETILRIPELTYNPFAFSGEALEEITITVDKEERRRRRILDNAKGPVTFLTDLDRETQYDISEVLREFDYALNGDFSKPLSPGAWATDVPLMVDYDGVRRGVEILSNVNIETLDYVEFNLYGQDFARGPLLILRSHPDLSSYNTAKSSISAYDIPLTFDASSPFKTKLYDYYNDEFFNTLGVVDWLPDVVVKDGKARFTIEHFDKNKFLFHIQGWTDDGMLIDELREVKISN